MVIQRVAIDGVSPVDSNFFIKGVKLMFKVGDYVVYKRDICKVIEIKKKYFKDKDYYVLNSIKDESLTINIPVTNDSIRSIISKKEVDDIINDIPNIEVIIFENNKFIESDYKDLINSGNHRDLIKIIKTTYLRNNARLELGKKIGEKDMNYFQMAESLLYGEFSIALNMSYDETKKYVIDKVKNLK